MNRRNWITQVIGASLAAGSIRAGAQTLSTPYAAAELPQTYRRMLDAIRRIRIFDNHSHPGFPDDSDVDAMASPPGSSALRIRADNPELIAASESLFGYPYPDFSPAHTGWLVKLKAKLKAEQGVHYFDNILDKVGIETAIANRVAMPPYLDRQRFLWAFFVDSFLFPFNNSRIRAENGDQQVYIPLQEKLMQRELGQAGLQRIPDSLDGYLSFVSRVLELNRTAGGIAIKFEAAYFRSLYFADPPKDQADAVYAQYANGGSPKPEEYIVFQDFIFRHLMREAARLHLAAHFHTSVGIGDFFSLHNGNVLNLENVLRDPRYGAVNFVLLHGGFPSDRSSIWLTARKNVYLDTSLTDLYLYPSEFKNVLKYWLSTYPDKVLFGSDAFPFNEALGAEEAYWLSVNSSREALAAALAELVSEKAFSEAQALTIARGYLHDNAAELYKSLAGPTG